LFLKNTSYLSGACSVNEVKQPIVHELDRKQMMRLKSYHVEG